MKGHDIGKGISLYIQFMRSEQEAHDDVDAWQAPSECHDIVSRGEHRRFRKVRRHIKAVTGLKWEAFRREVKRRTGSLRWMYYRFGFTV